MVEIMWVRVNYKVMFIMVEETGVPRITVVYPIRNGHFKMADCKSSKR